ncbi:MAG: amidohydrolase [Planctomycetota bacterium]|nr:amidohydrolase [Planctomycetota bacterium]
MKAFELRNLTFADGSQGSLVFRDGRFVSAADDAEVVDCRGKLVLPPLHNAHTHTAMTLLRGYGDDMPLQQWLEKKIWPAEANLTQQDVFAGAMLGCMEMALSGTSYFCDMYWHPAAAVKAAVESGLRAASTGVVIDMFDSEKAAAQRGEVEEFVDEWKGVNRRVSLAVGPHAIYTVSEESLVWCARFARDNGLKLHIHIAETEKEVQDCRGEFGLTPVQYLDRIGFLGPDVIGAHCVWLTDEDVGILADRGVTVAHIPVSNMKLAVGEEFSLVRLRDAGVSVTVGTDGCSSNNNLDMFEEMKFAAMLAKSRTGDPTSASAREDLEIGRTKKYRAARDRKGNVQGREAPPDLMLLDISHPQWFPCTMPSPTWFTRPAGRR